MDTPVAEPVVDLKAKEISGNKWAAVIRAEVKDNVALRISKGGSQPTIGCLLVGERTDSAVYVRNKEAACTEVGIRAIVHRLPGTISQQELIDHGLCHLLTWWVLTL